jgi:uncharacterized protein
MRWQDGRESDNVEDARGESPGGGGGGFPGGRILLGGGGLGGLILMIVLAVIFGPQALLGPGQNNPNPDVPAGHGEAGGEDEQKKFVRVVLAETEDVWDKLFGAMHKTYRKPKLHLFRDEVQSACGLAEAAVGPFYCPGDEKI